jgi:transcriptional regulator with XRE-family HTH domain
MAEMLNVNRGMISSYEEGRAEPRIETILKTAEVFQLSTDLLLKNSVTVNQLSGFTIPQLKKPGHSKSTTGQEKPQIFSFLPATTQAIQAGDMAPNPFLKKNDIALALPAPASIGKLMILKTNSEMLMGKINAVDANKISIDNAEKTFVCKETLEILGIYSPVQNLTPLEERIVHLEARLKKLEEKAGFVQKSE